MERINPLYQACNKPPNESPHEPRTIQLLTSLSSDEFLSIKLISHSSGQQE